MKNFRELNFRQVHLDFHTSEHIGGIGSEFNKKQFQNALIKGHVNSITVFAVCHHGWCYYPTEKGSTHPNLVNKNLLPEMLQACKEINVKAPVYITVGWNDLIGREHPEWIVRDKEGNLDTMALLKMDAAPDESRPWGWPRICMNTPYLDYLADITAEVMEKFNPCGIFYDITGEHECYCDNCLKSMKQLGIDTGDSEAVKRFGTEVYKKSLKRFTDVIWAFNPEAEVYHNSKDKKGREDLYEYFSHYEIESLPTGAWGYDHFPQTAKYFVGKGMETLGMTGKFHTAWGEFGGYKNPEALKYECARMIAMGTKCSIGDQMPPDGHMDEDTYRIIGEAYKHVEEREKWCSGIKSIADVGILCPSAVMKNTKLDLSDMGAAMMFSEAGLLYDMIDEKMDFSAYKLLVLPDEVLVNDQLKTKLNKFTVEGGKIIASYRSGLGKDQKKFALDMGLDSSGCSDWDIDYTRITDLAISDNMVSEPFLNYETAWRTEVEDARILANVIEPYFKRTYKHFCSHRNTPPSGKNAGYPAVTRKGGIIYIAHPLFRIYQKMGAKIHRDMLINCVKILLPEKKLTIDLPSCGTVTLFEKQDSDSWIMHALYAAPVKRGEVQVIEDIVPLYNVKTSIKTGKPVKSVVLQPEAKKLDFRYENGRVDFVIPELKMHAMAEISFN